MTKPSEEPHMGPEHLGMENSLPTLGFPGSRSSLPSATPPHTKHPHSVPTETPFLLDRQGSTITHPQRCGAGWFEEIQGLGCSALNTSCYLEGSLKEAGWRIAAERPYSLEGSSVLQGASSNTLPHPPFQDDLEQDEGKRPQKEVEEGWAGGTGQGPEALKAAARPA